MGLARQTPTDRPLSPDLEPHGGVAVCLHAPGHVVEGGAVGGGARGPVAGAGDVLDLVGDGVPGAALLVGACVVRGVYSVALDDEGVEVDHAGVIVEEAEGHLSGDGRGEGRDARECGSFRHDVGGMWGCFV